MKKTKRTLLSFILTATMAVSSFPVTAYAQGETETTSYLMPVSSTEYISDTAGFPENLWSQLETNDVSLDKADIGKINEVFGNIVVLAAIGSDGIYGSDEYAFAGKFEHETDLGKTFPVKPFTEYKYDEATNTLYHAALEARLVELENGEEAFIIRMGNNENDDNFYLYKLAKQMYKGNSQWVDLTMDDFRYYILTDDGTGRYVTKNDSPKPITVKKSDVTTTPDTTTTVPADVNVVTTKAVFAETPSNDDESLPFEAKLEDNFSADRLVVMFKGKYSKEELEETVIPELKEINGVREFRYMFTGGKGRTMYIIDLDFERDDKESAYNTAKTLYDTGYFYCVEMNMIPIAAMQTTTRADIAELPAVTTTVTAAAENFKSMTLDEAITAMSGGDYAWMSGVQPELLPVVGATYHGYLTIGKDNKIHNIQLRKVLTRIKVKVGKELPYDDIKAAVEANGMIMPVIRKNGNDYEITSAATKECYYYTLDLIKKCPEVTAIDMQYKLCEDKVNYIQFDGIYYNGEQTAEELIAKYPELELIGNTKNESLFFAYKGEKDKLYDFFCRVRDNGDCFAAKYITTELAALNEEYFYCNEPVLIDGTAGDANIDGYVDISDSVIIMQSIANPDRYGIKAEKGITAQGTANGDTDENGLTNMDSLEIQKSLLGMGSIPIPPKDKDINLVSYDPIDFTEEYDFRSVTIDEKKFDNSGVTASKAVIGNEIGDFETVSAENGNRPAKVYEIKNITPEYAVAVQYEGSNNYYVYRYIWYIPQTIGQLLTDLDLENQLTFLKAHYEGYKPHYERSVALAYSDKDKIWNTLFSDKDAEVSRQDITKWPSNRKAELSISCETPLFGRTNFGIRIHENGYISTNIVDGGMGYYIDAEKAQELISLYASAE